MPNPLNVLNKFSIHIIKILIIVSLFADLSTAIQCFRCGVATNFSDIPACSKFDASSRFTAECPFSTMCLKAINIIYLKNGMEQKTTTMGCAQQKKAEFVLRNGKWEEQISIMEIYPDDCIVIENNLAATKKINCYCRGHLCNSGKKVPLNTSTILLTLLFVCITYNRLY